MTITKTELQKKRATAIKKATAIQTAAEAMERDLNDDEVTQITALMDEADALDIDIQKYEARDGLATRLASASDSLDQVPAPRTGKNAASPLIEVGEPKFTEDPNRGFKSNRNFFEAVMNAGVKRDGKSSDERLQSLWQPDFLSTVGSDEMSGDDNAYGGFMVPTGFSPDLLKTPGNSLQAGLFERTRRIPMDKPSIEMNARVDKDHSTSVSGGLRFYRRKETEDVTASRAQVEKLTLKAHSLMGVCYETEELLADSPSTYRALVADGFQEQYLAHMEGEMLDGTGVGEFEGVSITPSLIDQAEETDQTADTINYNNIIKMRSRIWGYQNAVWVVNQDVLPEIMALENNAGNLIWRESANGENPSTLLGRPLLFSEYCETLGDQGDIFLINPNEYLTGIYQPLKGEESIHVRFLYNERTFKFTTRNAGRAWWRSALTPAKSAVTLSPFVTLQARA